MRHDSIYRASASEFPHDNPEFDRGALWLGSPLCRLTPQPPLVLEEETPEHSGVMMRPEACSEPLALNPEDFMEDFGLEQEERPALPQAVELVSGDAHNDVAVVVADEAEIFSRFVGAVLGVATMHGGMISGAIARALLVGDVSAVELSPAV